MATSVDRASLIGIGITSLILAVPSGAVGRSVRQTLLNLYSGRVVELVEVVEAVFECDNVVQLPNFAIGQGTNAEQLARIGSGDVIVTVSAVGVACLATGIYSSASDVISMTYAGTELVDNLSAVYTQAPTKKQLREGILGYTIEDTAGLGYDYDN
jgi:hypothetical protein